MEMSWAIVIVVVTVFAVEMADTTEIETPSASVIVSGCVMPRHVMES